MPSGKTHDAVTFLLVAPTLAAAWSVTGSIPLALIVGFGFVFGGLMFGPDLDTVQQTIFAVEHFSSALVSVSGFL